MAIAAGDIDYRLSGGAANADVNASLGGAKSSVELVDATLHNLFDLVSSDEANTGDTEYRCIYVHNAHATLTLQNAEALIQSDTPNAESDIEIALGTSIVNGTEQTVIDESTEPTAVSWETGATPLAIGDIPPGEHKAIWIKRVISAAASAYNADTVTLRVRGDTAA